ncbi:hypothetical protein RRG08_051958 [Elysia crispata]|uniref:Uncharacterized protein n=1 Tax=Elysia crispata TaxID=231223 RepID=A0AAE1CRQ7_9GAST|nr:hypothetical protein RRG08_051958 [Elysia crispata]
MLSVSYYSANILGSYPSVNYSENTLSSYPSVNYSENILGSYPSVNYSENILGSYPSVNYSANILSGYPCYPSLILSHRALRPAETVTISNSLGKPEALHDRPLNSPGIDQQPGDCNAWFMFCWDHCVPVLRWDQFGIVQHAIEYQWDRLKDRHGDVYS